MTPRSGRDARSLLGPLTPSEEATPDPGFASALEQRLRFAHAVRLANADRPAPASVGPAAPHRVRWIGSVVAAAALVAGAVLGGVNAFRSPAPSTVQVAQAVDARAISPDGQALPLHAGAQLPDGTVIQTGPTGRVDAGGSVVGPDSEAVVHAGHVSVLGRGHSAGHRPAGGPSAPPSVAPGAGSSPVPSQSPEQPAAGPGAGSQAESQPPETRSPAASSAGRHQGASGPSLRLSVRHPHRTAELSWSAYDGPDLYGYVVMRAQGSAPEYPGDVVHFTPAGSATSYTDSAAGPLEYQVAAIDSAGHVLAESNVAR